MGYCSRSGYQRSLDAQVPYLKWQYNNECSQPSVSIFGICGFNSPCISFKVGAKLRAMANTLYSLSWSFILQIFSWISPSKVTFSWGSTDDASSPLCPSADKPLPNSSPKPFICSVPFSHSTVILQHTVTFKIYYWSFSIFITYYLLHPPPQINAEIQ